MARYRRDVEIEAFPRDLLDGVVRALLDAAEEAPITERGLAYGEDVLDGVRLVEGRHLAPGARYRAEQDETVVEVRVVAWNRVGESRIEATVTVDGHKVDLDVAVRMFGRRLHTVRITGDYQGPKPFRALRRAKWECEVRAGQWWSAPDPKTPPVSVRVVHPFAFAELRIARRKDRRGRWSVRGTARFGGRSLLRLPAAVGLAVLQARIRRTLNEGVAEAVSAWNAEVPDAVKHGMRERLDFEHRISLKAVPREWAEAYVAALHKGIEGLTFKKGRLLKKDAGSFNVRLLKGKHIEPGARYRISPVLEDEVEPLDVKVAAWELDGPNRIEVASPDDVQTAWVEIDSALRPTTVRAGFAGEFEGFTHVTAAAEGDLERWWSGGSPLTGTAENPEGKAGMTVERLGGKGGEWTVRVAANIEGRAWTRHIVAIAGVFAGSSMRRSFREAADAFARKWNGAAPGTGTPEQAADATLRAVLDR